MKTLVEIGRRVYGHDGTAINRHAERTYEDESGMRYILSRTLDGVPPFFEAYGPFKEDHQGCLPHLKVNGKEYWGDGWAWKRAERKFCNEIHAVIGKRGTWNSEQGMRKRRTMNKEQGTD
jgi:hypothetical protein